MASHILYQTSQFVIVQKEAGIAVQGDDASSFVVDVAAQLGVERVWLVHRLDKMTSGALLLALNAQAASELAQLFANKQVTKTYVAVSAAKPSKKQGWVKGDMEKSRRGAWKLLRTMQHPAITYFTSFALGDGLRGFVLHPHTGKTHQLRVALKSLGSPIVGDTLYGGVAAARMLLHARRLRFTYQHALIDVTAPWPDDWPQHLREGFDLAENA